MTAVDQSAEGRLGHSLLLKAQSRAPPFSSPALPNLSLDLNKYLLGADFPQSPRGDEDFGGTARLILDTGLDRHQEGKCHCLVSSPEKAETLLGADSLEEGPFN